MYKRKSSDKQIDELVYKAEHDGFGINEEELDEYMSQYSFGGGSNPIGTIIAFMGNTPPEGYLACDGSEYDIVDYPKLAKFFKDQFGSTQYFGGTGDKFKVPDLRGEFLRGTGTNSHSMGGVGESVGVHQAPTKHKRMCLGGTASNALIVYSDASDNANPWLNNSVNEDDYSTSVRSKDVGVSNWISNTSNTGMFTSRPTNTSVLYCIKADTVTTDELDETYLLGYDLYSNDEIVIGCWTNGKPIYQKTIQIGAIPTSTSWQRKATGLLDVEWVVNIICTHVGGNEFYTCNCYRPTVTQGIITGFDYSTGEITYVNNWRNSVTDAYVTIQYTKSTDPENSFDFTQLSDVEKININNVTNSDGSNNYYIGYDDYSTNEKIIGQWTNGKPLYQRAFTNVNPKSNTVLLSGVENIADWTFLRPYASNDTNSVIAHEGVINDNWVYVKLTNGNVVLSSVASAYSAGNGTFVIKYTKTSDAVNSFDISQLSNYQQIISNVQNESNNDINYYLGYNNYSTNEEVIGCWTDGRPLYQKTFIGTTSSSTGYTRLPIGATIDMGIVVDAYIDNGIGRCIPIDTVDTTISGTIKIMISNNTSTSNPNQIEVYNSATGWRNCTFVATIRYTKTTDTANSFNITQLSNFTKVTDDSNNYSTDEKVIGTWIDGKPLYQKTITGYSIPSGITDGTNKAVTIDPSVSNLSRITSIDGFIASDTSTSMLPLNGILGTSNSSSVFSVGAYVTTANKVNVTCNKASLSGFSIFLTIRYTKTTD